jgi:hypothetical protein
MKEHIKVYTNNKERGGQETAPPFDIIPLDFFLWSHMKDYIYRSFKQR